MQIYLSIAQPFPTTTTQNIWSVSEMFVSLQRSNFRNGIETVGESSRLFLYPIINNSQVKRLVVCCSSNASKDKFRSPEQHHKPYLFNVQKSETMNEQNSIVTFSYEGTPVSFSKGEGVMVNATEMAKPFGKTPKDWLRTNPSKEFISTLSSVRHICPTELVVVNQGGSVQGTWMHEDVALEFARWLSPKFAIWCNDRIKQLLTHGVATVADDDAALLHAMQILQRRIDDKQQRLQMAESQLAEQQRTIQSLAPMADYTRQVLQSQSTYTLTQVAKDLGMRSVRTLTDLLRKHRILFRQSDQWLPTANYASRGYFKTRTASFIRPDNTIGTSLSTVVTEQGRVFLHNFFNSKNNKQ